MSNIFNVAALFVLLRESLEAALIVGVLLNYIKKTVSHDPVKARKLKAAVWWGSGAGLAISIVIGVVFTVIFYVLKNDVFDGAGAMWEGVLKALAVVFLTWMGFSMLKADDWYGYWEAKLNKKIKETAAKEAAKAATVDTEASAVTTAALTPRDPETTSVKSENTAVAKEDHLDYTAGFGARPRALFLMAFTVVVREGLESVVFITGVGQANPVALILPGIVGIIIGVGVGVGLYYGAGRFRLDLFLKFSAAFLFVIAAGLAAGAAHEFEEYYFAVRPELGLKETTVLWDVCACCSHKENAFFSIAYALVGWRCVGTVATVTTYFTFWAVVLLGYVLMRWYKARLAARGELEKFEGEVVPAIEDVKANGQGQGVVAVAGMEEEVPEKAKVGSSL